MEQIQLDKNRTKYQRIAEAMGAITLAALVALGAVQVGSNLVNDGLRDNRDTISDTILK